MFTNANATATATTTTTTTQAQVVVAAELKVIVILEINKNYFPSPFLTEAKHNNHNTGHEEDVMFEVNFDHFLMDMLPIMPSEEQGYNNGIQNPSWESEKENKQELSSMTTDTTIIMGHVFDHHEKIKGNNKKQGVHVMPSNGIILMEQTLYTEQEID